MASLLLLPLSLSCLHQTAGVGGGSKAWRPERPRDRGPTGLPRRPPGGAGSRWPRGPQEPAGGRGRQQDRQVPRRLPGSQRAHVPVLCATDRAPAQQPTVRRLQNHRPDGHRRRQAQLQHLHAVPLQGLQPVRLQPQPPPDRGRWRRCSRRCFVSSSSPPGLFLCQRAKYVRRPFVRPVAGPNEGSTVMQGGK